MKLLARLILGTIAAGLAAGLVGASTLVLVMNRLLPGGPESPSGSWVSALYVFGIILTLYGLAAAFVIGIPAHLILNRMKRTGWLAYLGVGLAAGALIALAFGGSWPLVASGVAAGLAGAWVFWLIVRPDIRRRSAP